MKCDSQLSFCDHYDLSDCRDELLASYCPILCGPCDERTISITTTRTNKECANLLDCNNSGYFDTDDCSCHCLPAWSGPCKNRKLYF